MTVHICATTIQLISIVTMTTCLCIVCCVAEAAEIEKVALIDVSFTYEAPRWLRWSAVQGSLMVWECCRLWVQEEPSWLAHIKALIIQSTHKQFDFTCVGLTRWKRIKCKRFCWLSQLQSSVTFGSPLFVIFTLTLTNNVVVFLFFIMALCSLCVRQFDRT